MPYTTITLGDLRTRLASRWEAVPFWTDDDATDALNSALRIWNLLTGTWRSRVTFLTVANQHQYSLPGVLSAPVRVTWQEYPLTLTGFEELGLGHPAWQQETIASGGDVPTTPQLWVPLGLTSVALWPADDTTGRYLVVDGIAATPVLVAGGDALDLDDGSLAGLLDIALGLAAFKQGGTLVAQLRPRVQAAFQVLAAAHPILRRSSVFRAAIGGDPNRRFRPRPSPTFPPDPRAPALLWPGIPGDGA